MNAEIDERLQNEIIRRALKKSYLQEKQKEEALNLQNIIDALQEITNLSRTDLEQTVEEVRGSLVEDRDFFSIKNQIILAVIFLLIFICISVLIIWLF